MEAMAQPTQRPRKTVEDYLALPDDVRAELIDGVLYVTPAPAPRHQRVLGELYSHLRAHVLRQACGEVLLSPVDVHLPSGDVVQPDLVFISTARQEICTDLIRGVPDLLIEILSPSAPERDRFVKRVLYEQNAVREYWIADPEERTIEVLHLVEGAFAPAGYFREGTALVSRLLEGLRMPVDAVFPPDPA